MMLVMRILILHDLPRRICATYNVIFGVNQIVVRVGESVAGKYMHVMIIWLMDFSGGDDQLSFVNQTEGISR